MAETGTDKESMARALREDIAAVVALRTETARDASLREALHRLKAWQSQRLAATYADLLADARYRPATTFFLDDLYGAKDFSSRDEQLARVVPIMCNMLPAGAIHTIGAAVRLDLLSESLDRDMARALMGGPGTLDDARYAQAYRAVGRRDERDAQIALTAEIGEALDALTAKRSLKAALVLMRKPARVAGFGSLQEFLERGFEAFRQMRGAKAFLATIVGRERAVMQRLFETHPDPFFRAVETRKASPNGLPA